MAKITIEPKALTNHKCMALNYKKRPARWEEGTVRGVEVGVSSDGSYSISYRVLLDRRTTGRSRMFRDGGAPIFITVGDDGIQKI